MEEWLCKNTEIFFKVLVQKVIFWTTGNQNHIQARFCQKYVIITKPTWLSIHVLGSDIFVINPRIQVYCCAIQLI